MNEFMMHLNRFLVRPVSWPLAIGLGRKLWLEIPAKRCLLSQRWLNSPIWTRPFDCCYFFWSWLGKLYPKNITNWVRYLSIALPVDASNGQIISWSRMAICRSLFPNAPGNISTRYYLANEFSPLGQWLKNNQLKAMEVWLRRFTIGNAKLILPSWNQAMKSSGQIVDLKNFENQPKKRKLCNQN